MSDSERKSDSRCNRSWSYPQAVDSAARPDVFYLYEQGERFMDGRGYLPRREKAHFRSSVHYQGIAF